MSTPNSLQPHLSFLVNHGSQLRALLKEAGKSRDGSTSARGMDGIENEETKSSIFDRVRVIIRGVLKEMTRAQGPFVEESMKIVVDKIERTLQQFIELDRDNAAEYEKLALRIKTFKSLMWDSRLPQQQQQQQHDSTSSNDASSSSGIGDEQDHISDFESIYEKLSPEERQCLLCFLLFRDGAELEKRELIYWWIGMGVDGVGGSSKTTPDHLLTQFVNFGLIEHFHRDKKPDCYRMPANVSARVRGQAVKDDWGGHKVASLPKTGSQKQVQRQTPRKSFALLDISELHVKGMGLDHYLWMTNVKVVHLGTASWKHDNRRNSIVVEDLEILKPLKHLENARFLSLQGISGIVKMPDWVYKLANLRVLDLRACNNLEILPQGVGFLRHLMHLDLSECYLLAHVPKDVTSLSELRVLKGFVINSDTHPHVGNPKSRQTKHSESCAFTDLSKLKKLRKLTVRTRRMNFPTRQDLQALCKLKQLNTLRVEWVGDPSDAQTDGDLGRFPGSLRKLELRTMPKKTASRLLGLIRGFNGLQKLYIRGGDLQDLGPEEEKFVRVNTVRLRYLPKLHMNWHAFRDSFPSLTHLEIFECPNLIFFPCDQNGLWER